MPGSALAASANNPLQTSQKLIWLEKVCRNKSGLDGAQARTLVDASERIVGNIRAGRSKGSAEAHIECQEALRVSW
jgi:hypothetical protein